MMCYYLNVQLQGQRVKAVAQSQNRLRCLANICPYLAVEMWIYEPKLATQLCGSNPSILHAV